MNKQLELPLFMPEDAFKEIKAHWTKWAEQVMPAHWVVGISGGVDSAVVAALAVRLFGEDSVVGVQLPCGEQHDIADSDFVLEHLKIRKLTLNIQALFQDLQCALKNQHVTPLAQCLTNAPARLRMTMLYAVAQSMNGIVLNTCNISETCMGNDTLFGDSCGSYAPIKRLTKTEVVALAEWLGLPGRISHKTPIDGLQELTDEQRLGVTYLDIDRYIRGTAPVDEEAEKIILNAFNKNKFKINMITIQGPEFSAYKNRLLEML